MRAHKMGDLKSRQETTMDIPLCRNQKEILHARFIPLPLLETMRWFWVCMPAYLRYIIESKVVKGCFYYVDC